MIYLVIALLVLCAILAFADDSKLFFYWILEAALLALLIAAAVQMG